MHYIQIPGDLIQRNKYVILTADVLYANNLSFVITYGRGIGFIMAKFMPNRIATQLVHNLKIINSLYFRASFIIQTILMNIEFDKVVPEIPEVVVNTSAVS